MNERSSINLSLILSSVPLAQPSLELLDRRLDDHTSNILDYGQAADAARRMTACKKPEIIPNVLIGEPALDKVESGGTGQSEVQVEAGWRSNHFWISGSCGGVDVQD